MAIVASTCPQVKELGEFNIITPFRDRVSCPRSSRVECLIASLPPPSCTTSFASPFPELHNVSSKFPPLFFLFLLPALPFLAPNLINLLTQGLPNLLPIHRIINNRQLPLHLPALLPI